MICKIRCEYTRGDVHDVYTDLAPTLEMASIMIALHRAIVLAVVGVDIPLAAYEITPLGGCTYEE